MNVCIKFHVNSHKIYLDTLQNRYKVKVSGIIINTRLGINNWIKKNYKLFMYAAYVFEVNVVVWFFVMDQKLYNKLMKDMPHFENNLSNLYNKPKIRGSNLKTHALKIEDKRIRNQSIREYFYGSWTPLYSHSFKVK